jgi:hypothetical protein
MKIKTMLHGMQLLGVRQVKGVLLVCGSVMLISASTTVKYAHHHRAKPAMNKAPGKNDRVTEHPDRENTVLEFPELNLN